MIKVRLLPIHLRDLFISTLALIFVGWSIICELQGKIKIVGWDNKAYPPDSLYAHSSTVFLIFFFCYAGYIVLASLWKERILYIRSSQQKKLLTTDANGCNTIESIPVYELGKCFVAIRWIPPKLDVAKIKAFHVYTYRHHKPSAKFEISMAERGQVVGKISQYVSVNQTFRSDRWGKDTTGFAPPPFVDSFDLKIHVTSQYYEAGDPRKDLQPPPDSEKYQVWVWWGLTIREWLQLKKQQKGNHNEVL